MNVICITVNPRFKGLMGGGGGRVSVKAGCLLNPNDCFSISITITDNFGFNGLC